MKLLLSGEGATDMGQVRPSADGLRFVPGPMAWIVDRLIDTQLGYSQFELWSNDTDAVRFVGKGDLAALRDRAPPLFPGAKHGKGHGHFTRNAELLGIHARQFAQETQDLVVAVLFRDSDGTRSSARNEWQQKFDSIRDGFKRVEFASGVAMVPRPKSEAWLICALKPNPYQHCDALEDESGNDESPNSLKRQLAALFDDVPDADEQADWVRSGQVNPNQLSMPSFAAFRQDLTHALEQIE